MSPCIVCGKSVQTSIVVKGSDNFKVTVLEMLGVPEEDTRRMLQARFEERLVEETTGSGRPAVVTQDGVLISPTIDDETWEVRTCTDHAAENGWTANTVGQPRTFLDEEVLMRQIKKQ